MAAQAHPTLTERITARLAAAGEPRAVVISMQTEIHQALTLGLNLSDIWQQLHEEGRFRAGYDRFRRLVHELGEPARHRSRGPKKAAPERAEGFVYNPTPNPNELF